MKYVWREGEYELIFKVIRAYPRRENDFRREPNESPKLYTRAIYLFLVAKFYIFKVSTNLGQKFLWLEVIPIDENIWYV